MCYGETHGPCLNVADEIAFVLIVFGFIFLIFGTITCGFTLVVWRSTVNETFSVDNEIKGSWPDLVQKLVNPSHAHRKENDASVVVCNNETPRRIQSPSKDDFKPELLRCIIIIGLRRTGEDLLCTLHSGIIERIRFEVTVPPVSSGAQNCFQESKNQLKFRKLQILYCKLLFKKKNGTIRKNRRRGFI